MNPFATTAQTVASAVAVVCIVGLMAHCSIEDTKAKEATKRACIEARGEWVGWGAGRCELAP